MNRRAFLEFAAAAPLAAVGIKNIPERIPGSSFPTWWLPNDTKLVHAGEAGVVVRWAPMFVGEDVVFAGAGAPHLQVRQVKRMKRLVILDEAGNVAHEHLEP